MTEQSTYNINESFFKNSTKNAQFQHYFRFGSINFRWTYCYLKLSSIRSINISDKKIEKITFFKLLPVDDGSDGNQFEMHFSYLIVPVYDPWKFQVSIFNHFRENAQTMCNLKNGNRPYLTTGSDFHKTNWRYSRDGWCA